MNSILFTPKQIYEFIKKYEPFNQLSDACLFKLALALEVEAHAGDTQLIKKGEKLSDLYILIKGRLYYKITDTEGNTTFQGEYNEGSIMGEMALISDLERSADVYTLRDSIILKLTKRNFLELCSAYPELLNAITQFTIKRLTNSLQGISPPTSRNKSIALMPLQDIPDLIILLHQMIAQFPYGEKILLLTSDSLRDKKEYLNENGHMNHDGILWINQQEEEYSFIIYLADPNITVWSKFCIRQADSIAFLAQPEHHSTQCTDLERYVYDQQHNFIKRNILIFLHRERSTPKNTQYWLKKRKVNNHYHIRINQSQGIARFMRVITDNTVSLVLSGGGARGLAHIGVYRLLEELNIPIDYIAGTSMGAIIAALFAMGHSAQETLKIINTHLLKGSKIDFTFPYISIASGKYASNSIITIYGETTQIEDLWINYFCVSTDLISQNLYVHDCGLLWESIRSSISLPFIYPPVSVGNKLLLDGGILNNIPIDVMRRYSQSSKIIASNISSNTIFKLNPLPHTLSGWKLLYNKFMGKESILPLNLGELVLRLLTISSHQNTEKMIAMADNCISLDMDKFGMLDFKHFNEIAEEGYQQARKQFSPHNLTELLDHTAPVAETLHCATK